MGGAHKAAGQHPLVLDEHERREVDHIGKLRQADDDRHAARPGHRKALEHRRGAAHRHEDVVGADAVGQFLDGFNGVNFRRVDGVGGAEIPGAFKLAIGDVHGDDGIGAGDGRPLDGVKADAADADDDAAAHDLDFSAVDYRPEPGDDAAGEQGRLFQRHIRRHFDDL